MFPLQLILFGLSNQLVVSYKEESTMAFKQLFIKNYGGEDEDDYSASVFTQQDFYNSVSYVMEQVGPLCLSGLGLQVRLFKGLNAGLALAELQFLC